MTPQLFSIEHAPAALPYWHTILDDLGRPPVHRIAKVLGIGRRTVYRYHQTGYAPRVVMLALFWLTRWGRSAVHAQATNDAVMAVGLVRGLNDRIRELAGQVEHLQRLGHFASANAPLLDAAGSSGGSRGVPVTLCPAPCWPPPPAFPGKELQGPLDASGRPDAPGLAPGMAAFETSPGHAQRRASSDFFADASCPLPPPAGPEGVRRGGPGMPQAPQGRRPGPVRPTKSGGRRRRPA